MDANSQMNYQWDTEPDAGQLVDTLLDEFTSGIPFLKNLQWRLLSETGTRLKDWVDHFDIDFTHREPMLVELREAGFEVIDETSKEIYVHPRAIYPAIARSDDGRNRVGLKVESLPEFLSAHQIQTVINGRPFSEKRIAQVVSGSSHELWAIEKHGIKSWQNNENHTGQATIIPLIQESFLMRNRHCTSDSEGFMVAEKLIEDSVIRIGVDRTCDLFFQAERQYWQVRNRAARIQRAHQDALGMGWANHDHHTYRSSRSCFAHLIKVLETLGFECRERFYAGAEAGWGAQVLEQQQCGIVVFADVDLSEEELAGDFAHQGLRPKSELGTVGLWCALHGEAFLEAGLHHLECQFDFRAARELLAKAGVQSMEPFTNFEFLKQCFTEPEFWKVDERRLERLVKNRQITESKAEVFRQQGAIGSHLEILERNDGYKGFNQTGVSQIISRTDPRKM